MRENILQEIRTTVKAAVKNSAYSLIIDIAAETANGTPVVLFSTGTADITDAVLVQLNIGAPAAN
jgi:Skp family chaperone for outer membrane proteins